MPLSKKELQKWDKGRDLMKEIEEGVDKMIKDSITTYYNVISDVGEVDCGNETYFTTTDKDLAEKYLQKYNDVKSKLEALRNNYEKANDEHFHKLVFEKCGFKHTDEDYYIKLCNLSNEENVWLNDEMDKFVENLPVEIRSGIFVRPFPKLTIVESTDEMNFEKFIFDSAEKDVKEHLKSLI